MEREQKNKHTPSEMLEAMDKREKYQQGLKEADKFREKIDDALSLLAVLSPDEKIANIKKFVFKGEHFYESPISELKRIFGSNEGTNVMIEMYKIGEKLYPLENDQMTPRELIDVLNKQKNSLMKDEPYNVETKE